MKKIQKNRLAVINGGMKCGWVGILGGISLSAILINPVGSIGSLYGLSSNISGCWNS